MTSLLLPTTLAIVLALLRGGSLGNWNRVSVRGWPLAIGGLVLQLVLFEPPVDQQPWIIAWGTWLWVGSLVAILGVLLANAFSGTGRRPGWLLLAALGVGLNLCVVVANGGTMPRSVEASFAVRGQQASSDTAVAPRLRNTAPMTPDSRLTWLGDVLPEPSWVPLANVLSVGDLLLSLGLAAWAYQVTRRRSPAVRPPDLLTVSAPSRPA